MIYNDAFGGIATEMWGGIADSKINLCAYYLCLDAFSREGVFATEMRNILQREYMKAVYANETALDLLNRASNAIPLSDDLIRRVLNNTCDLYNDSVERQFTKKGEQEKKIEELQINDFLQKVNIQGKFNSNILAFIGWDFDGLKLKTINPAFYQWFNKNGEWELWICEIREKEYSTMVNNANQISTNWQYVYRVWTDRKVYLKNKEGKDIEPAIDNPVGFIPVVEINFSDFNKFDYYDNNSGMFSLLMAQLEQNALDFSVFTGALYSNAPILWLENITIDNPSTFGVGRVIQTWRNENEAETRIEYIASPTPFTEVETYKHNHYKQVLKNNSIPSGVVEGGGVMSGEAMKIDRIELEERRKNDIKIMEYVDKQILAMIDRVSEAYQQPTSFGDYTILYGDFEIFTSPKEKYDLLLAQYQNNLISIYDLMRGIGYNGTDEEIKKILEKIREINGTEQSESNRYSGLQQDSTGETRSVQQVVDGETGEDTSSSSINRE